MSAVPFEAWPKIPRYNRGIVITEKIDGTNAAVVIVPLAGTPSAEGAAVSVPHLVTEGQPVRLFDGDAANAIAIVGDVVVFAQSRSRFITPERDNYGFAAYVAANAEALVATLGVGRHFGEWWGQGIQRRYGLAEKRFSLFNARRWRGVDLSAVPRLGVVPVLYEGPMDEREIQGTVDRLRFGSVAAPGYATPEGVVVFHDASRTSFKITCENDAAPKGPAAHALDEEVAA